MNTTEKIDNLEDELQKEKDAIEWEKFENILLHKGTGPEEMKLVAVMKDIGRLQICRDFVRTYGESVEIPCSQNFSLIIAPCLDKRNVCVQGRFVMSPDTETFFYNNVYDSYSELDEWFDALCKNMAFGFRGAPRVTQFLRMSAVKNAILYYSGPRAKGLYQMIDEYLNAASESRPGPVIDDDED